MEPLTSMLHCILRVVAIVGISGVAAGLAAEPGTSRPLFRDFMGINGHTVQFKPELYKPTSSQVRDYHPVEWDLGNDSKFALKFPFARNGVDWNKVYGSWRKAGWRIDVSLMFESLPRDQWKDLAADSMAYAERFAHTFGPSSKNHLVESIEIGNEPGKYSDADYRTIFENMARGIKSGDSKCRVATCALTTGSSHNYAKSVECIAGLADLYDALNIHTYAMLEGWPTWRRSFPEDPALKDYLPDIRKLCEWRNRHAPGKEVWITEFGYDATTEKPNPKSEFKQWVGVTDQEQAQWCVRSWLVFAALPVNRAYLYFFNDNDAPQLHGSSGLTRNFQPKPAFYSTAHLYRVLGDYRFSKALIERPGDAMLYEFTHANDARRRIWVAWSPTGSARTTALQMPPTNAVIEKCEQMPLCAGDPPALPFAPDSGKVAISESPLFLFLKCR